MNLAKFLLNSAQTFPERPAISHGTAVRFTYSALARRVASLAGGLISRFNLGPEARVAVAMSNCPEYMEVLLAIWHAGWTAVPINAKLHSREIAYILGQSNAQICFVSRDLADAITSLTSEIGELTEVIVASDTAYDSMVNGHGVAMRDVSPEDVAWLFYTSGTTGQPKGAALTHRALLAMILSYFADIDWISEHDCIIHAAPMSHGSGFYSLPHLARAANQVFPESGRFIPAEVLELIAAYKGVTLFLAPTMIIRLLNTPEMANADTTHLKTLVYGGAPMYVEHLKRALNTLGPKLVQIYGQGESPMTITALSKSHHANVAHPRYLERLTSVGLARTGVEVRVVDAQGTELGRGEVGEILVRGDVVMKGYWRNEAATRETMRDGWLHTGDLGTFDEDAFLTLKDRSKDLIITGGSNVYPREVEEVLLREEGVLEASVVGRPTPSGGKKSWPSSPFSLARQ
jgi:long-chain acyl-CoA synthetase